MVSMLGGTDEVIMVVQGKDFSIFHIQEGCKANSRGGPLRFGLCGAATQSGKLIR